MTRFLRCCRDAPIIPSSLKADSRVCNLSKLFHASVRPLDALRFVQTTFVLLSTLISNTARAAKYVSGILIVIIARGNVETVRFAFTDALRPRIRWNTRSRTKFPCSATNGKSLNKRVDAWTMRYTRGLSLIGGLSGKKYYEVWCSRDLERAWRCTFALVRNFYREDEAEVFPKARSWRVRRENLNYHERGGRARKFGKSDSQQLAAIRQLRNWRC